MTNGTSPINLRTLPLDQGGQLLGRVGEIELRDTFDNVFGKMVDEGELTQRERNRRLRGIFAYRFMREKARVRDVIENWDRIVDPTNEQPTDDKTEKLRREEMIEYRRHLETTVGFRLTSRERFFNILKYRLNGAVRVKDSEGYRRLRIDETHPVLKEFDGIIEGINAQISPEDRLALEVRISNAPQTAEKAIETLPQPHTVRFGRIWWFEPDVPVPDKTTRIDADGQQEAIVELEGLRRTLTEERAYIVQHKAEITEKHVEKVKAQSKTPLSEAQIESIRTLRSNELEAKRDMISKIVDPDEMGVIDSAVKRVRAERIPALWALEWAKDDILGIIDEKLSDPFMGPLLAPQRPDYAEACEYAMLRLAGKTPDALAREALERMKPETAIFTPGGLAMDIATMFAESDKVEFTTVGDRSSLGRHKGTIYKERGKVLMYLDRITVLMESEHIESGDHAIADTFTRDGPMIILNPTEETKEEYLRHRATAAKIEAIKRDEVPLDAETKKETEGSRSVVVQLAGNMSRQEDADAIIENGAKGSGLVRSEEVILPLLALPSPEKLEKLLFERYRGIARRISSESRPEKSGYPVNSRALDLGGDKVTEAVLPLFDGNDPLVYRGLQVLLGKPEYLRANIRAYLRAKTDEPLLEFMFPMVESAQQIQQVREQWVTAEGELSDKKARFAPGQHFGAMIETVNAAKAVQEIVAAGAEYLAVGTNDLTCARLNLTPDEFQPGYHDHDPAVLRLLKRIADSCPENFRTVDAKDERKMPLEVCGDMAGTITGAVLLVGMGYRKLSMVATEIPLVKRVIRDTPVEVMEQIAAEALAKDTSDEVIALVKARMMEKGIDLDSDRYRL